MEFKRPEIIRPPSEWRSYYLPLTSGCSNNTCGFCGYYGTKLKVREPDEVKSEIDALALYMDRGVVLPSVSPIVYALAREWDGKRVFMQDGDALVYPFPKMLEVLDHLNAKFPNLERVAVYATPKDILRRSAEELNALNERKLDILYMGVESGDDDVLARVQKGASHDEIVEAGAKAKVAGMALSVTVILGLGGLEGSENHVRETARILSELDTEFAAALTLTVVPGTPLYQEAEEGRFEIISPFQSLEELRDIVERVKLSQCFFSSMHASNYFSVRGTLPQDRDRIINQLNKVLSDENPSMLRPEYLRGL